MLWRVLASALIIAILYERYKLINQTMDVGLILPERLLLGRDVTAMITVRNTGPQALTVKLQLQANATLSEQDILIQRHVVQNAEVQHRVLLQATALGQQEVGQFYARVLGIAGLVWWRRPVSFSQTAHVVPDSLAQSMQVAGLTRQGNRLYRHQTGAENSAELLMLRDYQNSDPIHLIDWKASARSQSTKVRVFSKEQQIELVVLLDIGRSSLLQAGNMSRLNHYSNITARLAESALQAGDRVGLISFAGKPVQTTAIGKGRSTLLAIREHLQQLQARREESNPLFAVFQLRRLLKHRGLVVFLTEIAESEAATQLLKATALLTPKHVPLIASVRDENLEQMKQCAGDDWLDPYRSYAAHEYTQAVQRSVLRLRRLGGHVLMSRPSDLDRDVLQAYDRLRNGR